MNFQDELPLVSVLVSSYNEERYIGECIASIKNQTYPNIELIVIDDASTDATSRILREKLSSNDVLVVNDTNLKHSACFNKLLEMASGKYIKIVMADDVLMPKSIEESVEILERDPAVSLVAHGRQIIDHNSQKLFDIAISKRPFRKNGRQMFLKCLASGTNIIGEPNACMFRRSDVRSKNFWDLSIIGAGELTLWQKILDCGDFYYDPTPLCGFRVSPKSATFVHSRKIAKHFMRYVEKLRAEGYGIPQSVVWKAWVNSHVKQELRRLVYLWIRAKLWREGKKDGKAA
jgi:glycosyltransferase involved in cell wall biosynthesis